MILDRVVRAARKEFGDIGPLVAIPSLQLNEPAIFLIRPCILANIVIQVVVPPLTALLTGAARQLLRHGGPRASAMLMHKLPHLLVFELRPLLSLRRPIPCLDLRRVDAHDNDRASCAELFVSKIFDVVQFNKRVNRIQWCNSCPYVSL